jgi:hypothetical protein
MWLLWPKLLSKSDWKHVFQLLPLGYIYCHVSDVTQYHLPYHSDQHYMFCYFPWSQKPWRQEIANTPDWPRRKAVAEFRLCVRHDCLGTHLHCIGIRPNPFCMLCNLRECMDRNHLGQCATLANGTECERYWEARTKMMENWLYFLLITITTLVTTHY